MKHRVLGVIVVGGCLAACGGDGGHQSPEPDAKIYNDAPADMPDQASGVSVVAHMLHGAKVGSTFNAVGPVPAPPTDGSWYVTPDQAKVTIEMINFEGAGGGMGASALLTNCSLTFNKTDASLASLLDCPFTIPPGSYAGMTVHIAGTFDILINDATNGIFTDPASGTKLSSTAPSGGAATITYTRQLGGTGIQQQFPTTLTVAEGDTVSLAIVLDAIQTLRIAVSSSGSTLTFSDPNQIPVNIFATLSTPGRARYFTSANTAESYNDSSVLANIVRLYEGPSGGQPLYLFDAQTAGQINSMCATPAPAYPIDPAMSTPLTSGEKLGGWLGRDSSQTTCWAVPTNNTFAAYKAYFTLSDVANIGDGATLSCEATTSPTPPTSGNTYASGCPSLTADATATLQLVAQ